MALPVRDKLLFFLNLLIMGKMSYAVLCLVASHT